MVEMDSVVFDNGFEYLILDKLDIHGNTYLLLSNCNDVKDIKIGKSITQNGQKYFCGIEDDNEFNSVLITFNSRLNNK